MLDQAIRPEPLRGETAIEAAAAAATELAAKRLPDPPGGARDLLPSRVRRRLALARSPIGIREQLTARRLLARSELPRETSHGDFHAGNILIADGSAFVVDWENCGIRPAGFDLIRLWMTLDDEPDREHLLKRALDLVGPDRHAELMRLRYAVLVGVVAGMTTALASYDRDPYRTRQMLALLPQVREQAKG
jgi:streptomycin 6-kinase